MPNSQTKHLIYTQENVSIGILARDLNLSIKMILQCATEGMIPLFFPTFPTEYTFISVHKSLILQDRDAYPSDSDAKPVIKAFSLGVEKIDGLLLSREDCHHLIHQNSLVQCLFPAAVWNNFGYLDILHPFHGVKTEDAASAVGPSGWQIVCYDKTTAVEPSEESNFPPPIHFNIKPWQLYARKDDVNQFINIIHSPICLGDVLDGRDVRDDRPSYFSKKLEYLLDTSERIWRTSTAIEPSDYVRRREMVLVSLQRDEFKALFQKEQLAPGTYKKAADFIEPLFARDAVPKELKESWTSYLTPELLKLMAASKLFWSAQDVVLTDVATHPKKEAIELYLRANGISGNHADYAITLIRPENAARGRPVPRVKTHFERIGHPKPG